jgi:hypothetical protein
MSDGSKITRLFVRAIKSIGFVDYGANQEANILIIKRRDTAVPGTTNLVLNAKITGVDLEKRRVIAWAYVARKADGTLGTDSGGKTTIDSVEIENATDRDVVDTPEAFKALEDSFYEFISSGKAEADDMHVEVGVAKPVGGVAFTPEVIKALGIPEGIVPLGILTVIDIPKNERGDQLLADIHSGKRRQLSIVAAVQRTAIESAKSSAAQLSEADRTSIVGVVVDQFKALFRKRGLDLDDAVPSDVAKRADVVAKLKATAPTLAAKMEEVARTYGEIAQTEEARRQVSDSIWRLQDSFCSILNDSAVSDKSAMLQKSLSEFVSAMLANIGTWASGEAVEKTGAKIAAARMVKLKAAFGALQEIINEVEGDMSEKTQFDASKLDEAAKAHIAALEKRATDAEARATNAEGELTTLKSRVEELEKKATPTPATDPAEEAWKSTPPLVRKRIEDAEKRAQAAEETAKSERETRLNSEWVAKARGEFVGVPAKPEEFGLILKRASESLSKEDFSEVERVLKALAEQVKKAGLFQEIGRSGEPDGNSAQARVLAEAHKLMATDPKLTLVAAKVAVRRNDPALRDAERTEERSTRH